MATPRPSKVQQEDEMSPADLFRSSSTQKFVKAAMQQGGGSIKLMEHEDSEGLQDWSACFGTRVASEAESTQDLLLFAADTPNSWKVAALLEELAIPYDFLLVDISADEQKEPKYLQKNPNGRTPTLVDKSQSPPFAIFESGAILLYLADRYPSSLLPDDPLLRSEVVQWIMWQMSALGPMIGQCMYMKRIAAPIADDLRKVEFSINRFERESYRLLSILETRLAGREYLCGEAAGAYSLADVACYG
jgi:Glutathione S-transferase